MVRLPLRKLVAIATNIFMKKLVSVKPRQSLFPLINKASIQTYGSHTPVTLLNDPSGQYEPSGQASITKSQYRTGTKNVRNNLDGNKWRRKGTIKSQNIRWKKAFTQQNTWCHTQYMLWNNIQETNAEIIISDNWKIKNPLSKIQGYQQLWNRRMRR